MRDENNMKYKRLNIILIVDSKSRKMVLNLASSMGIKDGQVFYIDDRKYFAHITVYSPEFSEKNIPKIIEAVKKISERISKFDLPVMGFSAEDRSVIIDFEKTDKMVKIHETILNALNQFRNGKIQEKYFSRIKEGKYSKEQVEMIQKYGYPNVLELYHPHLTLGRFTSQEIAEKVARNLDSGNDLKIIRIIGIGISEMGPNGTCTNIIKEFDLR
jgi:2'-5' RNA ligase